MAVAKTPSPLFAELDQFTANLGPLDYPQLLPAAFEAGYRYKALQKSVDLAPTGATLVTFDIMVGKTDVPFEYFNSASIMIEPGQSSVSLAAQVRLPTTLIHMFFGRLPPTVTPPEQMTVRAQPGTDDIVIPDRNEPEQEYVQEPAEFEGRLELIDHLEPDGVPIFVDLYALGAPTAEVIDTLLSEVDDFLERAQSVETINAMGLKNPMMIKFVKDLGSPEDSTALMDMITRRRNLVAPPVLSNTRRRSAPAGAN